MKKLIAIILVNMLTAVRVIGVICLIPLFHNKGGVAAALLSLFCYFTDFLDGIIARGAHVSTFFGSAFDGAADKIFSIANLVILLSITKYSIFPIICEVLIVLIQTLKFSKNINVKSSLMGKAKTWVISLTVIILYLVSDIQNITLLNPDVINKISSLNKVYLYGYIFIPLYIFEVLTIFSYLKLNEKDVATYNLELKNIDIKLRPKTSLKNRIYNVCAFWLNNEFYEKYKDSAGLRQIRRYIKDNRTK